MAHESSRNLKSICYAFFGRCIYFVLRVLLATCRTEIIYETPLDVEHRAYVGCFWHEKLVGCLLLRRSFPKVLGLVSPSNDGDLIAIPLEKFGFEVVRGSSGDSAVSGLIALIRKAKQGYTLGSPVDGPKGPAKEIKLGMLMVSQSAQNPIIPIGYAFSRKLTLRGTWDKMQIPLPFSKIVSYIATPIEIPRKCELEEYKAIVNEKINYADAKAEECLKNA